MFAVAAVLILSRSTVDSAFGSAQDWAVKAGIWLIHWKRRALVTNVSKYMKNSLNADLLAFDYLEKDAASCSSANLASISEGARSSNVTAPLDSSLTKRTMGWPIFAVTRFALMRKLLLLL